MVTLVGCWLQISVDLAPLEGLAVACADGRRIVVTSGGKCRDLFSEIEISREKSLDLYSEMEISR